MRNYDQKIKDMTESVLPSTARVRARRTRAAIHRRDRHRVRQQLRMIVDPTDPACSDEVLGHDMRRQLEEMIDDRRTADKVGSLERWAERRVVTDPFLASANFDERVAYFRRLLPDNTIGRHALGHIRFVVRYLDEGHVSGGVSAQIGRTSTAR